MYVLIRGSLKTSYFGKKKKTLKKAALYHIYVSRFRFCAESMLGESPLGPLRVKIRGCYMYFGFIL